MAPDRVCNPNSAAGFGSNGCRGERTRGHVPKGIGTLRAGKGVGTCPTRRLASSEQWQARCSVRSLDHFVVRVRLRSDGVEDGVVVWAAVM